MFLECFPRLEPRWRPVAESRLRADLNDDRIVLSGKVDLTVGRAEGVRAGKVLIDLKTGGFAPSHRDDLRFYALIETLRLGVPPRLLASYYLDGGRLQDEVVSEDTLAVAFERVVGGRRRGGGAAPRGREPVLRPGAAVPLVPAPRHVRRRPPPPGGAGRARRRLVERPAPPLPSGAMADRPGAQAKARRCAKVAADRRRADPSVALVPVPKADEPEGLDDPRRSDVDEWGRSEHMRELARRVYGPLYRELAPGRVGGAREDPDRGRRAARLQPRRRDPRRRPGDHARHRGGARAARVRAGRRDVQADARDRHDVVAGRRRARPPGQRLPPPARAEAARPGVPRGHQGDRQDLRRALPAAPVRPRRLRADRHAGRRAHRADRGRRRRGGDADPLEERAARQGARAPVRPAHRQHAGVRPARDRAAPCPRRSRSACSTPCTFDVEPDQPRYSRSLVMDESEHIRQRIQEALFDMLRQRESVWFG